MKSNKYFDKNHYIIKVKKRDFSFGGIMLTKPIIEKKKQINLHQLRKHNNMEMKEVIPSVSLNC
jgi:hypothetical protein